MTITKEAALKALYRVKSETRPNRHHDDVNGLADSYRQLLSFIENVQEGPTFQQRVDAWLTACFGEKTARDQIERNHRLTEETLELVQSLGCTRVEAHKLVDYVFDRPPGEPRQEVGGVMLTLTGLCLAAELDMVACGEEELARVWENIEKIRKKQATKPLHSPLPQ